MGFTKDVGDREFISLVNAQRFRGVLMEKKLVLCFIMFIKCLWCAFLCSPGFLMTCKLPDDPPVVVPPMATLYRDVKVWRRTARRRALDSIYSIAVEPANGGVKATIGLTTRWIPGYLKNQHIILKTQGHVHWRPTFSKKCRTKSSCGNERYAIVYHGLCLNIHSTGNWPNPGRFVKGLPFDHPVVNGGSYGCSKLHAYSLWTMGSLGALESECRIQIKATAFIWLNEGISFI